MQTPFIVKVQAFATLDAPGLAKCYSALMLCLAASTHTNTAHAEEGSELKFFATESLQYDSNLFHLSSSANALSLTGRSSSAETIATSTLGISYNKPFGLQLVTIDVRAIEYRYQNFDYLNFTALNYQGIWQWSYTPHLFGTLSSARDKSLNSFSDFKNYSQRNEKLSTRDQFSATYELDARWRLLGGLLHTEQSNLRPLLTESGARQNAVETGVGYAFPSGSAAELILRHANGTYTDSPLSSATLTDSGFQQEESEVKILWVASPKTTATFKMGFLSRTHQNFSQHDFSGFVGSTKFNWEISKKSALAFTWTRGLGANQTSSANYIHTERFTLAPTWRIGTQTSLGLEWGHSIRKDGGSPGLSLAPSQRRDTIQDATLNFRWQPKSYLTIDTSLHKVKRSSNQAGLDFTSNIVNVSARLTF